MHLIKTFEQTGVFDPNNPNQKIREAYTPRGYASFYFNQIPTTSSLSGLRGLGTLATLPSWMQMGLVALVGAAGGYFAMSKFGDSIKPVMKKIPVIGGQFAGLGGRRRKRRR